MAMSSISAREIARHIAVVPQDTPADVPFIAGQMVIFAQVRRCEPQSARVGMPSKSVGTDQTTAYTSPAVDTPRIIHYRITGKLADGRASSLGCGRADLPSHFAAQADPDKEGRK